MVSYLSLPKDFTSPHLLSGLPEDTPILVGFSGGADSTALLHMLASYGKRYGAPIYAAHVNHGIRGAEADRDERFCRSVCDTLGIKIFVLNADVPAIAERTGESIETAARGVRYDFFERVMEENGIVLLATAHNANDNLETMIFNLARGTSLSGMCGIPEVRSCGAGTVIRPILRMPKEDILSFCGVNGLEFVTDSTNTDTDYTRNRIRAEIIPALCEINSGAVRNAARLSRTLVADSLCLESMKNMFSEELCEGYSAETEKLNGSPDAIVNRVLVSLYAELSEGGSLEWTHIDALRRLAREGVPHSSVTLPRGIEAVIENRRLIFRKAEKSADVEAYSIPLCDGINPISQTNCEIVIVNSQNTKNIYKNSILLSIDFATINGSLYARSRLAGDRILMGGMHKSVKKLMCDKKIPLDIRSRLPVICDGDGIVAIPFIGIRDGARSRSEETKTDLHFYMY
ncbi:MAG: tRNA lysidine(34) synthetase TilS [Clostridia bacterium]|nr:tRNA lysidine(34) synthetase TilS [Clostridia bacterium]